MLIEEISVQDLHSLGADISLIDVREDYEWVEGHVPHARHVVLATVPEHLDAFDGDPTYVICKSGVRSMQVCEYVAAHGRPVITVAGGTMAWAMAGYDIETGADA